MRLGTHTQALVVAGAVALLACKTDKESPATATDSDGVTEGDEEPAARCPVMTLVDAVDVSGTTPFGDFDGSYAAYGYKYGDCYGTILIAIVSDPVLFLEQVSAPLDNPFAGPPPFDGLFLRIARDDAASGSEVEGDLLLMSGGQVVSATGTVTLTAIDWAPWDDWMAPPADPWPQAYGHFVIDEAGIALEGTFVAPLCGWLSGAC